MLRTFVLFLVLLQLCRSWAVECPGESSRYVDQNKIHLSNKWTALGPFPAGLREHQLGSFPALTLYPLETLFNTSHPVQFPSTYGKDGLVAAKEIRSSNSSGFLDLHCSSVGQEVRLSYPDLDWSHLKQSTGWAGVQWQALLMSDLYVEGRETATVGINLGNGAEFTILSEEEYLNYTWNDPLYHTKWYNGDWYKYNTDSMQIKSEVPTHLLRLAPGKYKMIVKSVYEIRVFGDSIDKVPSLQFDVHMWVFDTTGLRAITTAPYGVVPDVVQGQFAGWGISFALMNHGGLAVEVVDVELVGEARKYLVAGAVDVPVKIESLQVRPLKLKIKNVKDLPSSFEEIQVKVNYSSSEHTWSLVASMPLNHIDGDQSIMRRQSGYWKQIVFKSSFEFDDRPSRAECISYKYTYLDSDDTVQYASVMPPRYIERNDKEEKERPVIMYLHGAGVGVEGCPTLQQNRSWVVQPMGRRSWGYDWQILSHISATTALEKFGKNIYGLQDAIKSKAAKLDTSKVMMIGHSNGGQGVYHYASHRPDEMIGVVVGAGYISLADYVPMTWQLGRHFNDAALNGILRSSLNAFENNLFASNLAGLPLLIKHGSIDDNVPTWHTKEMASLVTTWNAYGRAKENLVKVSEVANQSHYWPEFMKENDVQQAIDARLGNITNPDYQMPPPLNRFTLSAINPKDNGSKQGWKITQVETPGRMARLDVEYLSSQGKFKVHTSHLAKIQVDTMKQTESTFTPLRIDIDGTDIDLGVDEASGTLDGVIHLQKTRQGWQVTTAADDKELHMRPMGPMIRFLASSGPIQVIVPTDCPADTTDHFLSIARRFTTDAYIYGRLDAVILFDYEALDETGLYQLDSSNVLLLGGPNINAVSRLVTTSQTLIKFIGGASSSQFQIQDRIFYESSTLLTLFPHPLLRNVTPRKVGQGGRVHQQPMALLLHATDPSAIERGYSLLPVRTGTLLPEWVVVDKSSMWKGYGGVTGAGWFNHQWGWSEAMGYLS